MSFSDYSDLESITLGYGTLRNIQSFTISNNPKLRSLLIKDNPDDLYYFDNDKEIVEKKCTLNSYFLSCFIILDLPSLRFIQFGRCSFSSFSSLTLSSTYLVLFMILDLPILSEISLKDKAFYKMDSLHITSSL